MCISRDHWDLVYVAPVATHSHWFNYIERVVMFTWWCSRHLRAIVFWYADHHDVSVYLMCAALAVALWQPNCVDSSHGSREWFALEAHCDFHGIWWDDWACDQLCVVCFEVVGMFVFFICQSCLQSNRACCFASLVCAVKTCVYGKHCQIVLFQIICVLLN